jgi:hypothetical protein
VKVILIQIIIKWLSWFQNRTFTSQAEANSFVDITNHNPILITAKNNEIGEVLIVELKK